MAELLAMLGLAVQGGAWLRRWLRFTEPYHQARFEATLMQMAADTQRCVAEQLPARTPVRRNPMSPLAENPPEQPGKYYDLGKLRFEHQPNGRWGVSDGSRGVGGHRTPIGAYLALRRFRRVYLPPVEQGESE